MRLSLGALVVCSAALAVTLGSCSDSSFSGSAGQQRAAAKPTPQPTPVITPTPLPQAGAGLPSGGTPGGLQNNGTSGLPTTTNLPQTTTGSVTIPTTAIHQGSFTVWAVPNNPQPFQDYQIFIQVTLPSNIPNYLQSDLTGSIVGTDGYQQDLSESFKSNEPLTPAFVDTGTTATLSEWVPGAVDHVNDTVQVHSTLLNESQTIHIIFQ